LCKDLVCAVSRWRAKRKGVKIYPHRLRHTAATQLPNAGCRVTSIHKFLEHKQLSTTMVFDRVQDQIVADDSHAAISHIEIRLDSLGTQQDAGTPIGKDERTQLLALTAQLVLPKLNFESRMISVSQVREMLACPQVEHIKFALPAPMLVESGSNRNLSIQLLMCW
jgi:hypothetical protein